MIPYEFILANTYLCTSDLTLLVLFHQFDYSQITGIWVILLSLYIQLINITRID